MSILSKDIYRFNMILIKVLMPFFLHSHRINNPKVHIEAHTQAKAILKKIMAGISSDLISSYTLEPECEKKQQHSAEMK